jgi:hypothetical protein
MPDFPYLKWRILRCPSLAAFGCPLTHLATTAARYQGHSSEAIVRPSIIEYGTSQNVLLDKDKGLQLTTPELKTNSAISLPQAISIVEGLKRLAGNGQPLRLF